MKTFPKRARAIAVSASLLGLAGAGMTMLSSTAPAFAGSCPNGVAASPAALSTAGAHKSSTAPAADNANATAASNPAPAGGTSGGSTTGTVVNTSAPVNDTGSGTGSGGPSTTGTLVNTNAPVQAQNPASGRASSGSPVVNTNAPVNDTSHEDSRTVFMPDRCNILLVYLGSARGSAYTRGHQTRPDLL